MASGNPASDSDRCARCGEAFHCGVDDEQPCWCTRVQLNAAALATLRQRYRGCLCARCLAQATSYEATRA